MHQMALQELPQANRRELKFKKYTQDPLKKTISDNPPF